MGHTFRLPDLLQFLGRRVVRPSEEPQIVFDGEPMTALNVVRLRDRLL